jgi:acyl carrier protein
MITIDNLINSLSDITGIPANEFNVQTALYGSGIISSLMMLELMSAIEKEYRIYIRPEELIEDNFADVGRLKKFIERKQLEDGSAMKM